MRRHKRKWIVAGLLLAIVLFLLFTCFRPVIYRKEYIEELTKLGLPETARILDYKFGIGAYGISPFYAKVEIDQETFELWTTTHIKDPTFTQMALEIIMRYYHYKSLNVEDVEDIWITDMMTSEYFFGIAGSTRIVYLILTEEADNSYYLYVLY